LRTPSQRVCISNDSLNGTGLGNGFAVAYKVPLTTPSGEISRTREAYLPTV